MKLLLLVGQQEDPHAHTTRGKTGSEAAGSRSGPVWCGTALAVQGLLQALTAPWGGGGRLPELNRDELVYVTSVQGVWL